MFYAFILPVFFMYLKHDWWQLVDHELTAVQTCKGKKSIKFSQGLFLMTVDRDSVHRSK